MADTEQTHSVTLNIPKIIYILYMAQLVAGPTGLIGVILAYVYRSDAPEWLASHYQFQIRTFWIGLLYIVIGIIASIALFLSKAMVILGSMLLIIVVMWGFWAVWMLIRCTKGLKYESRSEAHPDPEGWFF